MTNDFMNHVRLNIGCVYKMGCEFIFLKRRLQYDLFISMRQISEKSLCPKPTFVSEINALHSGANATMSSGSVFKQNSHT